MRQKYDINKETDKQRWDLRTQGLSGGEHILNTLLTLLSDEVENCLSPRLPCDYEGHAVVFV